MAARSAGKACLAFKDVPGPRSLPFIGNSLGYSAPGVGRDASQSPRIWDHLQHTYGDLVRLELPRMGPTLLVFDPHMAEQVYRLEGPEPCRPAFHALRAVKRAQGDLQGVLTSNGREWREFRSQVQVALLRPESVGVHLGRIIEVTEQFMDRIEEKSGDAEYDLGPELYRWALETVATVALDTRLGCLQEDAQPACLAMVDLVHSILQKGKALDSGLRLWEVLPSSNFSHFQEDYRQFSSLATHYIHSALHRNREPGESRSLVQQLASQGADERTITAMASDLLFGGVDTTSHSCVFALHLLATHPDVQETLHSKLLSCPDPVKAVSHPYLRAVMRECHRLMPASLGNIRRLDKPLTLGQYNLEGGTTYILAHRHISRSQAWVPRAVEFLPSRWLRGSAGHQPIHPFASLPFGFGPRMCIGRRLAEQEILALLAATVTRFKVGWTGEAELQIKSDTLIFPDGPLHFTFQRRR